MKTQRDNPLQKRQLHNESPQIFKERQSTGSDLNHISPIPTLSLGSSDIHSYNTNEKAFNDKIISQKKQLYYGASDNFVDLDIPNTLVKEFYKKPQLNNNEVENDFYFEDCDQEGYNSISNKQGISYGNAINNPYS